MLTKLNSAERCISFASLVEGLKVSTFERRAASLLAELESKSSVITFDFARDEPPGGTYRSSNLLNYYRDEVSRIPQLNKEEELQFCMGLELLWRRLKLARKAAGFSEEEIESFPGTANQNCLTCSPGKKLLCRGCAPINVSEQIAENLRQRTSELEIARNELIARHLFLVFSLLNRYCNVNVSVEDLVQEANFSMFKAVEGFDFTRGVRFRTYAGYWVNQAFLNAIYNQSRVVRVPAYIQKAMKKVNDVHCFANEPISDSKIIAKKSGLSKELVESATTGNRFTLSLDMVIDDDGARMMELFESSEKTSDPEFGEHRHLEIHLSKAMGKLTEREQQVLELRFGLNGCEPDTLQSVGERLGVSLERVRQIQKAALLKLRQGPRATSLQQYA